MKGAAKSKRKLIGSMSILSAAALVSVAFGPSILLNEPENFEKVKILTLRDLWDIIVPDDYDTIQEAVDNAITGDRIFVRSGVYKPGMGFINRFVSINTAGITIHGQDNNNTIIDGSGLSSIFFIEADETNFSGFTITNNGVNGTLLSVKSNNNIIENNILEVNNFYDGTEYAMKLYYSQNNLIKNNEIYGGDKGIQLDASDNNRFENNSVHDNRYGIDIDQVFIIDFDLRITEKNFKSSHGNFFIENNIYDNDIGIILDSSNGNIVRNNTFNSNNGNGLILSSSLNNQVIGNIFIEDGLDMWGSKVVHFIHGIKDNLVNNKPILYYYDEDDFVVSTEAGQIIIVNCSNVRIENVKISNTSTAILICFSSSVRVYECEISNNNLGVYLYYSRIVNVNRNNFIDNNRHASFISLGILDSKFNDWNRNYWSGRFGSRLGLFKSVPKKIVGRVHLKRNFRIIKSFTLGVKSRNYDIMPVRNPIPL